MVRHKNRYIVIEIYLIDKPHDHSLTLRPDSLYTAILEKISLLHGDFGLAAIKAGFSASYCNEKTRTAVIRARHGPHKIIASSLPLINQIEKKRVSVRTLYTGATIKQCLKMLLEYQRQKFDEFCKSLKTDEEKQALQDMIFNIDKALDIT